jgi:hypothetical protein
MPSCTRNSIVFVTPNIIKLESIQFTYKEIGEDARLVDIAQHRVEDLAGHKDDAELEQDRVVVGRQHAARHGTIHAARFFYFFRSIILPALNYLDRSREELKHFSLWPRAFCGPAAFFPPSLSIYHLGESITSSRTNPPIQTTDPPDNQHTATSQPLRIMRQVKPLTPERVPLQWVTARGPTPGLAPRGGGSA